MSQPYSMSFTTAPLLRQESLVLAALFDELCDWEPVRERVVYENRLQLRTANSARRITSELISRLKLLSPDELALLREGTPQEQGYLLWLAVCRRYRFIYDFAVEVVREKYLRLDLTLEAADYDVYFEGKAEWHPEVERVAAATRRKGRQFVLRMLREADLLSRSDQITPALLTPALVDAIRAVNPADLAVFPAPDAIRGGTQ